MTQRKIGKQVKVAARAAAAPSPQKKTALAKRAVGKTATTATPKVKVQRAVNAVAAPAKTKAAAAVAAWPQAMSSSGAVVTHSAGPGAVANTHLAREAGHRLSEPVSTSARGPLLPAAATWLEPWNQMSAAATRLMADDTLKAAMDRQLQLYQTMARFSPLHMSMQIMQGLLPARDTARRS